MEITFSRFMLAASHGSVYLKAGRFGGYLEASARVAGEPRLWGERKAGALRGRIGPLKFVADSWQGQHTERPQIVPPPLWS